MVKIPWRRKWQSTPVFLPGKFHRQRSLEGYSPWGFKELDMIKWLHFLSFYWLLHWWLCQMLIDVLIFFRWNHQWFSFQNKKNVSAILVYQRSIISSFIVLCHVYQENMWIHSTHHWLNVHEFEQTPGDSEGQGSLPCCSPWDCKESDTITTVILIVYLNVTVFRKLLECYWMNPVKHMHSPFSIS